MSESKPLDQGQGAVVGTDLFSTNVIIVIVSAVAGIVVLCCVSMAIYWTWHRKQSRRVTVAGGTGDTIVATGYSNSTSVMGADNTTT